MKESLLPIIAFLFLIVGTTMGLLTPDWVITPYIYTIGAAGAIVYAIQLSLKNKDASHDIRRLTHIFTFISCALAGAAYLLFCKDNQWWIAITLIYATMVLYYSFRNNEDNKR